MISHHLFASGLCLVALIALTVECNWLTSKKNQLTEAEENERDWAEICDKVLRIADVPMEVDETVALLQRSESIVRSSEDELFDEHKRRLHSLYQLSQLDMNQCNRLYAPKMEELTLEYRLQAMLSVIEYLKFIESYHQDSCKEDLSKQLRDYLDLIEDDEIMFDMTRLRKEIYPQGSVIEFRNTVTDSDYVQGVTSFIENRSLSEQVDLENMAQGERGDDQMKKDQAFVRKQMDKFVRPVCERISSGLKVPIGRIMNLFSFDELDKELDVHATDWVINYEICQKILPRFDSLSKAIYQELRDELEQMEQSSSPTLKSKSRLIVDKIMTNISPTLRSDQPLVLKVDKKSPEGSVKKSNVRKTLMKLMSPKSST